MTQDHDDNSETRKRYFSADPHSTSNLEEQSFLDEPLEKTNLMNDEQFNDDDVEFSAEFLAEEEQEANDDTDEFMMRALGWLAVAVAILAFFTMPVLFATAGIVLGFISRNRGHLWIGNTAIVLSILALIIQLLIFPFV